MKMAIRFEGGAELAAALMDLSKRVSRSVLREALTDAAEPMREAAARFAPRAPGAPDIADNIVISPAGRTGSRDSREVAVAMGPARGFFYGFFQEYGTVRHRAQPFMRPAFDGNTDEALEILRERLWTILASKGVVRTALSPSMPFSGGRLT